MQLMADKNPKPPPKPGAPAMSVPSSLGKIVKESGKPIEKRGGAHSSDTKSEKR